MTLANLLEQARPAGTLVGGPAQLMAMSWPDEHASHAPEIKIPVTLIAFGTAVAGILLATIFYCWRLLNRSRRQAAVSQAPSVPGQQVVV